MHPVKTTLDPHSDARGSGGRNETVVEKPPTSGGAYSKGVTLLGFNTDTGMFRLVRSRNDGSD